MNEYGHIARRHWENFLPERYREIPDPTAFFTQLGEEAQEQALTMEDSILASTPPHLDYLAELSRRRVAQKTAREVVLSELLPTPPDEEEDPITGTGFRASQMEADLMPPDPDHPVRRAFEDDDVSPEEYGEIYQEWLDSLD